MKEEKMMKRPIWKELIMYACLGALTGAAVITLCKVMNAHAAHQPPLAVVDMQALIKDQSRRLAKTGPTTGSKTGKRATGKVSERQLREASSRMKTILEGFAARHHLILLNKGAVMGANLPDHTAEILALLEQEGNHP